MKKPPIAYMIQYGDNGLPNALMWSSAMQRAADAEHQIKEFRKNLALKTKPMQCYIEWAKQRGLWAE